MTARSRSDPPARRPGSRSRSLSAASFGLSGSLARGLIDAGWSAGAVVLVRIGVAALVVAAVRRCSPCAAAGRCCAATPGSILVYGVLAVAGAQFCYFSAVAAHAGRRRRCSSSTPRRPRSSSGSGCATASARVRSPSPAPRSRGARPGAGARPALRCGPEPARRPVGARRDGRRRDLLRHLRRRGQRAAADGAGRRRPASSARAVLGAARAGRTAADARDRRAGRRTPARPSTGGCRCSLLGLVTAAIAYTTGIAASRRLGSRLASFVALIEVRRRRGVRRGCCSASCPRPVQLLGGLLILAGVVLVKLGERDDGHTRRGPVARRLAGVLAS